MPDTHGFETVAEFNVDFLRRVLRAAWKSGGDEGDPNVIPEFFNVPPGQTFGSWTIADGHAQIPQDQLDVTMAPDVNGIDIEMGMTVQVEIQDPPVPSVSVFNLPVEAHVRAPVGTVDGTINVAILLAGLPLGNVTATLTAGDPVGPLIPTATEELVHAMYEANGAAFPHTIDRQNQAFGGLYRADVFVELFDDASDPARRITISYPSASQIALSIPLRMRVSDIQKTTPAAPTLQSPMAITARLVITAPYVTTPNSVSAQLSAATVSVTDIARVPGIEGDNYDANNAALFGTLPGFIESGLEDEGQAMVAEMVDMEFTYPTVAEIEAEIREIFHAVIVARGTISVWTPAPGGGGESEIDDVTVKALPTALALGINAQAGADADALTDFIPAGREFAIGVSGPKVIAGINESIRRPVSEGGFGSGFPPHTFNDVEGHDVRLNRLDPSLVSGAIRMEGEVTVIDAIADKIDVDADFEVDVGLHWEDNADGTQRLVSDPGEPDVSLGVLAWIIGIILFFLVPLILAIVYVVVLLVVESTAERIGARVVRDAAGQATGFEALPEQLEHIGNVDARFENPIGIASDGVVFSG